MSATQDTVRNGVQPYQVSPRALARASAWAAAGAGLILVLFVLPAEWGIDPTGAGRALGLTRLADVDAETGTESDTQSAVAAPATQPDIVVPPQVQGSIEAATALRTDRKTLVLPPHSGIEVKARMKTGDHLVFRWTSTGAVRMDMHGEPKQGKPDEFTSYWKQKSLTQAQGQFTAPFEGTHGWYWRNGGEEPVTLTLEATGFYGELYEIPVE